MKDVILVSPTGVPFVLRKFTWSWNLMHLKKTSHVILRQPNKTEFIKYLKKDFGFRVAYEGEF